MFIVRMAWREMRCVLAAAAVLLPVPAVGVASIVDAPVGRQSVRAALRAEARTLLGADLALSTSGAWTPRGPRARSRRSCRPAPASTSARDVETLTMVRPADPAKAVSRLVELLGVEPEYPLYGSLELDGGQPYSHALLAGRGVLVRPELLAQLDVAVGDEVVIGDTRFTIRGVVRAEPGRRAGRSASAAGVRRRRGPSRLRAAGVRQPRDVSPAAEDAGRRTSRAWRGICEAALRGQFVSVRSYRSTEDQMGRELGRAENYLSLVGLVIVILGRRRRLERHAGLRAADAPQRGHPQVRGRRHAGRSWPSTWRRWSLMGLTGSAIGLVLAAVAIARLGPRCRRGHRARGGGRADRERRRAGRRHRPAGRAAVRAGAAAGGPPRAAVAAAARVEPAAASSRRGVVRRRGRPSARCWWRWRPGRPARGARRHPGRRFRGQCPLSCLRPARCWCESMRPLRRSRHLAVRYASRRVGRPGNQVGRSCWPWGSGRSWSSACACCRTTCCGRWRSPCARTRPTCS